MATELYNPGQTITVRVNTGVDDGHFVAVATERQNGHVVAENANAGDRVLGVAGRTRDHGQLAPVLRGAGRIIAVATEGTIAAGADVAAGNGGLAVTAVEGDRVAGYAVDDTDGDGYTLVSLLG